MLQPEAHLLYLCAHDLLHHGEKFTNLRQYLDLHLLITKETLDWDVITEQAAVLRWTYAVERALTLTSELYNTPVPAPVIPHLRALRRRKPPAPSL